MKSKFKPPDVDGLIESLKSISKNRSPLSDEDVKLLMQCIDALEDFKKATSVADKRIHLLKVAELFLKFFNDDITTYLTNFFK